MRSTLTVEAGEAWLERLGLRLLATQQHAAAQQAYDEAVAEVEDRLPPGRDLRGRAQRLLEKQLRVLLERDDRAGRVP